MASLRERILTQLTANLATITAGGAIGGTTYTNTFPAGAVQRWQLEGNDRSALPCLIVTAQEEQYDYEPSGQLTQQLSVSLEILAAHDRAAVAGSTDAYLNSLLRDVLLCVINNYRLTEAVTLQELCEKVTPILAYPLEDEEGHAFAGFALDLTVHYQMSSTNPDSFV